MATRNLTVKMQMRRDTAANWEIGNPTLAAGEIGYDTTNKQTKIGDGNTAWSDIDWFATKSKPTFADSDWVTINEIAAEGKAANYFKVGDEKTITLSTGEAITIVILGFNHDNLTAGGKAKMSIGMKNLLETTYYMNSAATNVGGWNDSSMRTGTMVTILSQLPADLQAVIKQVNKLASAGGQSATITISADKLFLFSKVEIDATTAAIYAREGSQYEYWRTVSTHRSKCFSNGVGMSYSWWLRSPFTGDGVVFRCVDDYGTFVGTGSKYGDGVANHTRGVSFGFCV